MADEILERWTRQPPIPGLEGILSCLNQPLVEEAKMPISQEEFDDFVTGIGRFEEDRCTRDDVEMLFRFSDTKSARHFYIDFAHTLKRQPPAPDKTEHAFVHFWDSNIL